MRVSIGHAREIVLLQMDHLTYRLTPEQAERLAEMLKEAAEATRAAMLLLNAPDEKEVPG
jgi:hypothetical protein